MCSYRPWWWWMASSRSCSSEGKSTSPHALHHESTLLIYCRGRNAGWHLCKLPHRYKTFHMRCCVRQCCIHPCVLFRSHMLVRENKKSPLGAFALPLVSFYLVMSSSCYHRTISEDFIISAPVVYWPVVASKNFLNPYMGWDKKHPNSKTNIRMQKWFNCSWLDE